MDGPPVEVDVDGPKVERIVENLLNNAARHTTVGTPIHVDVMPIDDGIDLIVEDEGPGVPDEVKVAIFQPFRQGVAARGASGSGSPSSSVSPSSTAAPRTWRTGRAAGRASSSGCRARCTTARRSPRSAPSERQSATIRSSISHR